MNAYLIELLIGDGSRYSSKNGRYMVWLDQNIRNIKILEKAKAILEKLGLNVFLYSISNNKKRVLVYSKKLFLYFKKVAENPANFFISLSENEKKEFIAGFLDAEGTVTDRVVIYNSNKELLEVIKTFLQNNGVSCNIYRFGKIYGIQIYKKSSILILKKIIRHSVKLSSLSS